ncbi:MAG: hypothetical protein IPM41_09170 [Sphingomonadales bacterium]|nr:hypothetical protein [Sphingomonadales bacterium]
MASYPQQMQDIFKKYQEEVSADPVDLKVVGAWAIANRLWHPRPIDIQSRFARDMADALREEYRIDKSGRRYRSKLAVTDGRQGSLWGDIDTSPRKHVEKNVAQRRKQVVGDCYQLQIDVDHYNENHPDGEQLRLILDFSDDVAERKIADGIDDSKAA